MALLWQRQVDGTHYQVRNHGASVRLYSNGVFHSQWNPRDPLKGSLWELLLLPAFFLPENRLNSVLILGVGGGALIRLLQAFTSAKHIVGVDLDPVHLDVARRFFGVRNVELVCADACDYVRDHLSQSSHQPFDLVIDDLFGHGDGVAQRAVAADKYWCSSLMRLLHRDGVLVSNFADRAELQGSAWRHKAMRQRLKGVWMADMSQYENHILAVSRKALRKSELMDRAPEKINPANPGRRLDFRMRQLR
ncbi:methyltransferase domain-containing protein [Microbulbifer sp. OS29]|uniref:Methyltransferase domain-containing protein n=1 Tax=Microbulbifer okhotskensis TaxID=2926617 RepID=A0A9X2J614_9GAMM|nr:methyltransferase domain-containing protein [Microbulbifer okhotskensis]MCO1334964.1 methyltransferase domain-containing protein [Microbulbifer okhotskensis]